MIISLYYAIERWLKKREEDKKAGSKLRLGDIFIYKGEFASWGLGQSSSDEDVCEKSSPSYYFQIVSIQNNAIILLSNWGSVNEVTKAQLQKEYIKISSEKKPKTFWNGKEIVSTENFD